MDEATSTDLSPGPRSFDQVLASVAEVDGWMTPGQARTLWDCGRAVKPGGTVVEIGSFRGRSLIVLAKAVSQASAAGSGGRSVELVSIEPHAGNDRGPQEFEGFHEEASEDHEVFNANLERARVRGKVRHVRKYSHEAMAEVAADIDLLYIDGAHDYRSVVRDLRWVRWVRPGGTVLVHDAFSSVGVTAAFLTHVVGGRQLRYVDRAQSMARFQVQRAAVGDRGRMLAQLPWFVRNVSIKVAMVSGRHGLAARMGHTQGADFPY